MDVHAIEMLKEGISVAHRANDADPVTAADQGLTFQPDTSIQRNRQVLDDYQDVWRLKLALTTSVFCAILIFVHDAPHGPKGWAGRKPAPDDRILAARQLGSRPLPG